MSLHDTKSLILACKRKANEKEKEALLSFFHDLFTLMKFSERSQEFTQVFNNLFDLDLSIEERRLCFLKKAGKKMHNIPHLMLSDDFNIYFAMLDIDELINPDSDSFSPYTMDLLKKCDLLIVDKGTLRQLFYSPSKKHY